MPLYVSFLNKILNSDVIPEDWVTPGIVTIVLKFCEDNSILRETRAGFRRSYSTIEYRPSSRILIGGGSKRC